MLHLEWEAESAGSFLTNCWHCVQHLLFSFSQCCMCCMQVLKSVCNPWSSSWTERFVICSSWPGRFLCISLSLEDFLCLLLQSQGLTKISVVPVLQFKVWKVVLFCSSVADFLCFPCCCQARALQRSLLSIVPVLQLKVWKVFLFCSSVAGQSLKGYSRIMVPARWSPLQ